MTGSLGTKTTEAEIRSQNREAIHRVSVRIGNDMKTRAFAD